MSQNTEPQAIIANLDSSVQPIIDKLVVDLKPNDSKEYPELIISLNGGAKRMSNFNYKEISLLRDGILSVASKLNTWIITAGFDVGVSFLAGDLVRHHELRNGNDRKFKLIGIVTLGKCNEILKNIENIKKPIESNSLEKLNKYHDWFIFVHKENEPPSHDHQMNFRIKFETEISKKTNKVVHILINGGKNSIKTLTGSLKAINSVIIIQDTGRAADIICDIIKEYNERKEKNQNEPTSSNENNSNEKELRKILKKLNKETIQLDGTDYKATDLQLVEVINHIKKIHILPLNEMPNIATKVVETLFREKKEINWHTLAVFNAHSLIRNNLENLMQKTSEDLKSNNARHNKFEYGKKFVLKMDEIIEQENGDSNTIKTEEIKLLLENNYWKFLDVLVSLRLITIADIDKTNGSSKTKEANGTSNTQEINGSSKTKETNGSSKTKETNGSSKTKETNGSSKTKEANGTSNTQKANKQPEEISPSLLYFKYAITKEKFEIAKVIWKLGNEPIYWALIGSEQCKQTMKVNFLKNEKDTREKYLNSKRDFISMAMGVLSEAYNFDKEKCHKIFKYKSKGKKSSISSIIKMAYMNNEIDFMNHKACQQYINTIWYGGIEYQKCLPIKLPLCILIFPFIFLWMFPEPKETQEQNEAPNDTQKYLRKISKFYKAPIVKFTMTWISYIILLSLYTYVCLVELKPYFIRNINYVKCEIVVHIYLLSMFLQEINQIKFTKLTLKLHFKSVWNIIDLLVFLPIIPQAIARYNVTENFVWVRIFYGINLSLLYFRFLQFYYPNKELGPKVIIVFKMFRDISFILAIYAIFVLAYGTFAQNVLFGNQPLQWDVIKNIFFYPYWQTYGELYLDVIKGDVTVNGLTANYHWTVMFSFAGFMLISNILLLNLLIAMFGNTYSEIQKQSHKIWGFNRYKIMDEYKRRSVFPPPFTFIYLFYPLYMFYASKYRKVRDFKIDEEKEENEKKEKYDMVKFECICRDEFILKSNFPNTEEEK